MFITMRGYSAPGKYPPNENTARHLARNAKENGLAAAFLKIQGRMLFDPDLLQQLIAEKAKADAAKK
jgi:hypothetical protein